MWARLAFAARTALSRATRAPGTRELSLALLVLVVVRFAAEQAWAGAASGESAEAFATSWSAWLVAWLVALDAAAHLSRTLPEAFPGWFQHAPAAPAPGGERVAVFGRLSLAAAWLLAGVGLLASLSLRDRFTLWVGDGERFEGQPGQYVDRAPPRWLSPGPKPLDFSVAGIWPHADARGAVEAVDVRIALGARATSTSLWRPVWLGGARFLRASGFGLAPRFEVADAAGRVVDSAFVKLDLLPIGHMDQVRSEVLPHRFYVRLAPGEPARGGGADLRGLAFQVDVVRGRRVVASGIVRGDGWLPFEGFAFGIPEVRHVAQFVLVDDPGIPLLAAATLLGAVGLGLRRAGRRPRAP